jgi:hypothetical protein
LTSYACGAFDTAVVSKEKLMILRGLKSARLALAIGALLFSTLVSRPVHAQQTDVRQYDIYNGFTFFETPALNLAERGYNLQVGRNMKSWLAVGFDYSVVTGHNSLTTSVLKTSLQEQLNEEIEFLESIGQLPPGYQLIVPTNANSQTFAFGPQFEYRHFKQFTLFARPSLGAIRQRVTPHPTDPFAVAVVQELVPSGTKLDWQGFYGFGGGFDWYATHHFGVRMQSDLVYWHLFNDLLQNGDWTVRFSVGPTFRFGKNILANSK